MTQSIAPRRRLISRLLDHWMAVAMVYAVSAATFIAVNLERFV